MINSGSYLAKPERNLLECKIFRLMELNLGNSLDFCILVLMMKIVQAIDIYCPLVFSIVFLPCFYQWHLRFYWNLYLLSLILSLSMIKVLSSGRNLLHLIMINFGNFSIRLNLISLIDNLNLHIISIISRSPWSNVWLRLLSWLINLVLILGRILPFMDSHMVSNWPRLRMGLVTNASLTLLHLLLCYFSARFLLSVGHFNFLFTARACNLSLVSWLNRFIWIHLIPLLIRWFSFGVLNLGIWWLVSIFKDIGPSRITLEAALFSHLLLSLLLNLWFFEHWRS